MHQNISFKNGENFWKWSTISPRPFVGEEGPPVPVHILPPSAPIHPYPGYARGVFNLLGGMNLDRVSV